MARTKAEWKGTIRAINSMVYVTPVYDNTQTAAATNPRPCKTRRVPAIDATGPDGRRWFLTFESEFSAEWAGTKREDYIKRMRGLAAVLSAEADRMEADPAR